MEPGTLGEFDLSPIPPPPSPVPPRGAGWPPAAQVAVGCGSGCAVLVLLEALALWGILALRASTPEGVDARIESPPVVKQGQKFPLKLLVTNTGKAAFELDGISLAAPTPKQLALAHPQPAPAATTSVWGSRTWQFRKSLAPGEKWAVRFDATPRRAGTLRGALMLQVGFGSKMARFAVKVNGDSPAPRENSGKGSEEKPREGK
jgi:hypothetical protein